MNKGAFNLLSFLFTQKGGGATIRYYEDVEFIEVLRPVCDALPRLLLVCLRARE